MRFGLGLTLALAMSVPSAAFPCGNAVYLETNDAARMVASAERALERGKYKQALRLSRYGAVSFDDEGLSKRFRVVVATAQLRLGQVKMAVRRFDALQVKYPKDSVVMTRLGEALSRTRSSTAHARALELLSDLERRDLMADAYGFAALASLRARAGDAAGQARALSICRTRAASPAICLIERRKSVTPKKTRPKKRHSKDIS